MRPMNLPAGGSVKWAVALPTQGQGPGAGAGAKGLP